MNLKLYVSVTAGGLWSAETFSGRVLFDGFIAEDGEMSWNASVDLPDAVESAVRRAWVNKKIETVPYTPAIVPRISA